MPFFSIATAQVWVGSVGQGWPSSRYVPAATRIRSPGFARSTAALDRLPVVHSDGLGLGRHGEDENS
jgi:hypothetical protein